MRRPFYFFIGQRYTQVKGKNHFISFMSLTSTVSIAIGVMVLITVLSVMNGFSTQIRAQMLSGTPHIKIGSFRNEEFDWKPMVSALERFPDVVGATPYILGQGMLSTSGQVRGIFVRGIMPGAINDVYPLANNIVQGKLEDLLPGEYGMVMGEDLAYALGLRLNDKISLIVPEATISPAGMVPRIKRFKLVGLFSISYLYDTTSVFIHLKDAQTLFKLKNGVTGVQLKVQDELKARFVAEKISHYLNQDYVNEHHLVQSFWVQDWTSEHSNFFQAIQMEKTVMFCILLLIVLIAAFNLVSSLVMMVTDKRADIAILRTMGAKPKHIMGIFLTQGSIIGLIGAFFGTILGLLLAFNVTYITDKIQQWLNVQFLSEQVYLISYIPSEVHLDDVLKIVIVTLLLSFVAALYPARRAAKIHPAEALRYD